MNYRLIVTMLCAQLLGCGDDSHIDDVDAGSDASEPLPSWDKAWEADTDDQEATTQWLAVSADGTPLLLQRFSGGIAGDANKEYRLLQIRDGASEPYDFELAGGEVLAFEAGAFGVVAVIRANGSLVALNNLNSTWNQSIISSTDATRWAVGRASDARPLVALQHDATPTTVEVHDPSSLNVHRTVTVGTGERVVAVSEDKNGEIHLVTSASAFDVHYAPSLEEGRAQIAAETGTPYFLPYVEGSLQLFNDNEVFNSYEGKTTWFNGTSWDDYDTVFVGSADRHQVGSDGSEQAWRFGGETPLFVCRPRLAEGEWRTVELKQSPLRSVLLEAAIATHESTLYLVSRRNATLYQYDLKICSP